MHPPTMKGARMIVLRPTALHWINGEADNPDDLCAHGGVDFRIHGEALTDPTRQGGALSAAALYLLRSLEMPHPSELSAGEPLFPCCGHAMYGAEGHPDVTITGCGGGEDFEVRHDAKSGTAVLRRDGREWHVGRDEWRAAVFAFADAVSDFYARGSPKRPAAGDEDGWAAFLAEWERRRGLPLGRR